MTRSRPRFVTRGAALVTCVTASFVFALPTAVHAQGLFKRMKDAAKEAASEAAARKAADAARTGTEKTADAVGAAAGELVGAKGATQSGTPSAAPKVQPAASPAPTEAAPTTAAPAAEASVAAVGEGAWANYDFVPGTRPLYVDDFSADNVGDFPRRLKWEKGTFEIVESQGTRWLRATSFGWFAIPLPDVLPERFTLEMDMVAPSGWSQEILFGPVSRGNYQSRVSMSPDRGGIYNGNDPTMSSPATPYTNKVIPVRVTADGQHVKVYMGETRVANVPQLDLGRDRQIRVGVSASQTAPVLIGNVRVMAGGKALYDALSTTGRVATQGVLFATGSDVVRPESTPTLKEIAAMLAAHPELRLTIEGHTDQTGDAASNLKLSQARADAVKAALVTSYRIDAARLTTRGFGSTKPAAPNATAEGRTANRRVELVKQ